MPIKIASSTTTTSGAGDVGIGYIERMSELAMCFRRVATVWATSSCVSFFFLTSDPSACPAKACARFSDACVFWRVFVTIVTMGAFCITSGHVCAAKNVNTVCDLIKMIRVYAFRVAAKVVENLSFLNWAMDLLPRPPPRTIIFAEKSVKSAVTFFKPAKPYPASAKGCHVTWYWPVFINLVPQLFYGLSWPSAFAHCSAPNTFCIRGIITHGEDYLK